MYVSILKLSGWDSKFRFSSTVALQCFRYSVTKNLSAQLHDAICRHTDDCEVRHAFVFNAIHMCEKCMCSKFTIDCWLFSDADSSDCSRLQYIPWNRHAITARLGRFCTHISALFDWLRGNHISLPQCLWGGSEGSFKHICFCARRSLVNYWTWSIHYWYTRLFERREATISASSASHLSLNICCRCDVWNLGDIGKWWVGQTHMCLPTYWASRTGCFPGGAITWPVGRFCHG